MGKLLYSGLLRSTPLLTSGYHIGSLSMLKVPIDFIDRWSIV